MKRVVIPDAFILRGLFNNLSNNKVNRKLESLFNKEGDNIIILDIVLNELSAALFQKKINYNDYKNWFKLRETVYEKLFRFFLIKKVKFKDLDKDFSNNLDIFKYANNILAKTDAMAKFIRESNNLKYIKNKEGAGVRFTFFTYTSSIIFAYVILYALNNKDEEVIYLIDNPFLSKIDNFFIENKVNLGVNFKCPSNLKVKLLKNF